ncbi:MAG: hypothetical protein COX30_04620 [Candidatus Moranbacteria bacterium CG23_combo_of_CG06-09_8_20_14_all_39_10]|nr:MAG: hypothetical protein COX30_04620 [Candidatus Moranbacteria bacterium CG23_combo_of_CG06-09_8_20_14_all_39_10]
MKNDNTYLEHILEAINSIESYLGDSDYEDFKNNEMVIDAVVRKLEIIGEASNNLSEKFKRENPEMPHRDAIDMRNFLIHEYFGVNTKIVWKTYKNNLPELKKFIKELLR